MIGWLLCWFGSHDWQLHKSPAVKRGTNNESPLTIEHDAFAYMADGHWCSRCPRISLSRVLPEGWEWCKRSADDWRGVIRAERKP